MKLSLFRFLFFFLCLVLSILVRPSTVSLPLAIAIGSLVAAIAICCEAQLPVLKTKPWRVDDGRRARRHHCRRGGFDRAAAKPGIQWSFCILSRRCASFFWGYLGVRGGASLAGHFAIPQVQPVLSLPSVPGTAKVLDTSTIIDGRIADVADAGFLDGPVIVAEFILRELQAVADSTDASKRQRGRRGLDMLERMRNCARVKLQVVADDFPGVREVDLKLIELAKKHHARLVTNDFNLNKVAHLHEIPRHECE